MISAIGSLGDRLLSRLVPRHTAQAACPCWTEGFGCVSRRCCYYGSNCAYGVTCGYWVYNC